MTARAGASSTMDLRPLAVLEMQHAAFEVDLDPSKVEDFAEPAASEKQEADRCCRERRNNSHATRPLQVFGNGLRLVGVPWGAGRLGLTDRGPEPLELVGGQIAVARRLLEFLDALCGIDEAGG
jgi:hypothetical protein